MGSSSRSKKSDESVFGFAAPVPGMSSCTNALRSSLLVVALASGACLMTAAAVSGRAHPWLTLVALLPLFRAIQVLRPSAATLAGAFFGASLCAFLLAGGVMHASGVQPWLLLVAAPALYAGLGAALTRRIGFKPFVLAVGWMPIELALRPLALRYGLLPGAAADGLLHVVVGRAFGYVLVAFLLAYASAFLLAILTRFRWQLRRNFARPWTLDFTCPLFWHVTRVWHGRDAVSPAHARAPPTLRLHRFASPLTR